MQKKKLLIIIGCLGILLFAIGVSYAYWSLTFTQTENNVVTTDCFEIEFIEGEAINLLKTYPISDSDGLKNTPYTFKIKNVCVGSATYQVNLETLTPSGKQLPDKYLKVNLEENGVSKITTKLESSLETEQNIETAVTAYKLLVGELGANETKEFNLRIWMHSDVTANDKDSMNAEYNGKVSIITGYKPTKNYSLGGKEIEIVTTGSGLYEVDHNSSNITYTTDQTAIQNLKQTEYRFAGQNPNNYVSFNNELWRIIGLVNTPEGSRIKLIRNESIGEYSWDTGDANSGYGTNEWSNSKIMDLLNNGAYYNKMSGTCYNGENNQTAECEFSITGLTNSAKTMIDTITWNIGSNDGQTLENNNINTAQFYELERSNHTGKICNSGEYCNDTITRYLTWYGQVGLMYPSDYAYATSGGSKTDRDTCLNMELYSWNGSGVSDCKNNDWLYKTGSYQWTMTPNATSYHAGNIFSILSPGCIDIANASDAKEIYPTIYLNENVKIGNGIGNINDPYELEI